ncbi:MULTISPECIES: hypothetical protein [Marivita]|uniref:Uncharacterized protein n=1 Tax=Marivita cryptomonadis TaxID=505252 RepID=A0A9Q2S2T2_9RHOB|nr:MULTISPECIES: hypothetical protein [Marivita]MCR9170081.1 hypothetical protein [Paracoccaceae bacterium]MBM2322681.1 hypothetical protein [Marivita cryptomonadis]MBM2332263.1 hypothetical protein [Marivita cryptomonadis]MBM2341847.1 hypothetical protein [Marivita cryptomonadis]MBM2346511.1 hypothetical protein [Marivita cryptomonadis]
MRLTDYTVRFPRSDKGWAERLGITRTHFQNIRTQRRSPSPALMRRIFDETDGIVTPNDLILTDEQIVLLDEEVEP